MLSNMNSLRNRLPIASSLVIVSMLLAYGFYHPFFFGDELDLFEASYRAHGGWLETLLEASRYKPRLVMNGFWAFITEYPVSRIVAMLGFATALGISAFLVFDIAYRIIGAGRKAALAASLLVVLSRFDVMLFFDYVSGTVETFSLAFFLAGAARILTSVLNRVPIRTKDAAIALAFFVLCVLVHERYIAGIFGFLFGILISNWRNTQRLQLGLQCALLSVIPLVVYVVLVKTVSETNITTGTSGQDVTIGLITLRTFLTYLSNVLLGSNYGPDWFVGTLNSKSQMHSLVFGIVATSMLLTYFFPAFRRGNWSHLGKNTPLFLPFGISALALILVASLPGPDRQEARWMFPVFSLFLLFVLGTLKGKSVALPLSVIALTQAFYLFFGGVQSISSVRVSRMASALGYTLKYVDFPGKAGLLLSAPEPESEWMLGEKGKPFCSVNLYGKDCVFLKQDLGNQGTSAPRFALRYLAPDLVSSPTFELVSQMELELASGSTPIDGLPVKEVLGEGSNWSAWTVSDGATITDAGLRVNSVSDNFIRLPSDQLDENAVIYEIQSVDPKTGSEFRLQINWHESGDQFISTQIETRTIGGAHSDQFFLIAKAPPEAKYGYVFATLQAPSEPPVLFKSVKISKPLKDSYQ